MVYFGPQEIIVISIAVWLLFGDQLSRPIQPILQYYWAGTFPLFTKLWRRIVLLSRSTLFL
ncbi:hypothetical protein Fuma_01767 [Fuerstiella marisgermanici]|uniref:Uncharacterized protein n=1 Tax=Fuerstiella marisgermanici TaxID=1891926 RepID=A0A1P8WDP3_9PLAN|nr:hypothetical protein Fuma_01767 [Fuerstiella marisgermanici]